jgi:AraC-like DNA-binding protein
MRDLGHFSTDALRPSDRVELWKGFVRERFGVDLRPDKAQRANFASSVSFEVCEPIALASCACTTQSASRTEREIADKYTGNFFLLRELGDGFQYSTRHSEITLRRGDMLVGNFDEPLDARAINAFDYEFVLITRDLVAPHLPIAARRRPMKFSGRPGSEAMVMTFLDDLKRRWNGLTDSQIARATDTLARLIGIACGAREEEHEGALCEGRLARLRRYIEQHLTDPSLSPETAAMAERISLRALHACFERSGESFSAHLRRRRVEKCRQTLDANPQRAVTDVALEWGFGSQSSFYRAFRSTYDGSPRDTRSS